MALNTVHESIGCGINHILTFLHAVEINIGAGDAAVTKQALELLKRIAHDSSIGSSVIGAGVTGAKYSADLLANKPRQHVDGKGVAQRMGCYIEINAKPSASFARTSENCFPAIRRYRKTGLSEPQRSRLLPCAFLEYYEATALRGHKKVEPDTLHPFSRCNKDGAGVAIEHRNQRRSEERRVGQE